MSEQPDNLVLELLRSIRATGEKTNTKVLEIEKHLLELRLQVAAPTREDATLYGRLAEHEARFERIEQRLNIRDPEGNAH
jgi:hypothetical protein